MKRLLASVLSVLMVLSSVTVFGVTAAAEDKTYKVGDIIEFGSYPQSEVKDGKLIKELNGLVSDKDWIYYDYTEYYYDEDDNCYGKPCNWMKYADVIYNGIKYRAVCFNEYRCQNVYTDGQIVEPGEKFGYQKENGYYTNERYWFKFEPIRWRILDPESGFVMSEMIIDSQPFIDNYLFDKTSEKDIGFLYFDSYICNWLNNDFYNDAFGKEQKNNIELTSVEIKTIPDGRYVEESESRAKPDRVFLPSFAEITNPGYGFSGCGLKRTNQGRQ